VLSGGVGICSTHCLELSVIAAVEIYRRVTDFCSYGFFLRIMFAVAFNIYNVFNQQLCVTYSGLNMDVRREHKAIVKFLSRQPPTK